MKISIILCSIQDIVYHFDRIRYPHGTRLLLSTCTNVPMFYACENLKNNSRQLNHLKMVRRKRNKQKPALDLTNRRMDHFKWTRNYSFNNFGIEIHTYSYKIESNFYSCIFHES